MFDAALRGGHREEEDADDFVETMALVLLCLIVSLMLYICGRWVERLRREEAAAEATIGARRGTGRRWMDCFRLLEIQRGTTGLYHGGRYDTRFVSGFRFVY